MVSRLIEKLGHKAVVIDARKARGVIRTKKKTDRLDARNLAKMSRTGWYTAVHRLLDMAFVSTFRRRPRAIDPGSRQ